MFKKNKTGDQHVMDLVVKENEKLRKENTRLHKELESVLGYKEQYEELIKGVEEIKKEYLNKLKNFGEIENNFKESLDIIEKSLKK